jgi:hypothetical protein
MAEKKKAPRGSDFWQIIFPTLLAAILILALGVWFGVTGSSGNLARFAEISVVLLAIPVFIASLLFGLVLAGLIFLVSKLIQGIPPITGRVLDFLGKIQDRAVRGTQALSRLVIEPIAFFGFFQRKRKQQDPEIKLYD